MKLSLSMIVKSNEGKLLDTALKSISKYVDEIVIVTEAKGLETVCKKYGAKLYFRKWDDNFSNQRNFAFEKCTGDWVLWIDSDDSVKNPQKIRKLLEMCGPEVMAIVANYVYQRDKAGNVLIEHWRERIVRNHSGFKWTGALHETLMNESNPPMVRTQDFEIIHDLHDEDNAKTIRNLQILEKEVAESIGNREKKYEEIDPRLLYYLGVTYKSLGMREEAEEILRKFVNMSGWDQHRFGAYLDLVDIALEFNAKKPAQDYALMAIGEFPQFPDGYFMAGKVATYFMDYKKGAEWLRTGFSKEKATGDWVLVGREQKAFLDMAICLMNLNDFKESRVYLDKLAKLNPKDKQVKVLIKENQKLLDIRKVADAFLTIFQKATKKERVKLLEAAPKELQDTPALIEMRKMTLGPTKWGERSVVLYCGSSWEDWSPSIVTSGIGGSEEAVINMALELKRLGWDITVFNSCGTDAGMHDGVMYKDYLEFNYDDEFNILIGWRYPGFFNRKFNARKTYLWMHDTQNPAAFTEVVLGNLDKVILLSKYHRSLFPTIPEEKVLYSANGILPEQFKGEEPRKRHKLIYSSCPSRGLEVLVDIWPEIKEKYKDAELDIYYGFENFIKGNENNPSKMKWMDELQQKMRQSGINYHGRIGHLELAREMMKSDIWAYPCVFPEISCITAMKAMCSGAMPVTIPYGAVGETLHGFGYQTKSTDIMKEETREEYKELLLRAMGEKYDRYKMMEYGKTLTWEKVAENWSNDFLG